MNHNIIYPLYRSPNPKYHSGYHSHHHIAHHSYLGGAHGLHGPTDRPKWSAKFRWELPRMGQSTRTNISPPTRLPSLDADPRHGWVRCILYAKHWSFSIIFLGLVANSTDSFHPSVMVDDHQFVSWVTFTYLGESLSLDYHWILDHSPWFCLYLSSWAIYSHKAIIHRDFAYILFPWTTSPCRTTRVAIPLQLQPRPPPPGQVLKELSGAACLKCGPKLKPRFVAGSAGRSPRAHNMENPKWFRASAASRLESVRVVSGFSTSMLAPQPMANYGSWWALN